MKIVIPGGSGALGSLLDRSLRAAGHQVVVLSRRPAGPRQVGWDGRGQGAWTAEIDGSDIVVNLAGRSVNCRYTAENQRAMMDSRVHSARAVGQAIAAARRPPAVWLQMSTATVYAHRHDAPNDELDGRIGGDEPDAPAAWRYSVDIARAWERAQADADTPHTRRLALRTAVVLGPERGGALDSLSWLARLGVGGPIAGGAQYVSWIHERDFARAVEFLIEHDELSGPVNLAAPNPLPQREFMRDLRACWGMPLALPATRWMAELGAFALRSESELLLKSRRVVPGRLRAAGFAFEHPDWPAAARDLVRRLRGR
ncbi:TIGR01777 family oxidoreductase [Streptomyces sp. CBMA123]|uniref:TIGR01777 family oxidoreductase n=1 Tax=Streptomyces sp. CBMA123 TaxID=1896313 RepID=UPI001661AF16|nr:TIGR01777 family oxidoreductase [Streptomyces sp. CBMA123]MBD0690731.1 TIGR01777 family protein [Streptomyces sp. CBMA123]